MDRINHTFRLSGSEHAVDLFTDKSGRFFARVDGKSVETNLNLLGRTIALLKLGARSYVFDVEATSEGLRIVHDGDLVWLKKPAGISSRPFPGGPLASTITLKSQLPGLITVLHVKENQLVKEGEMLLVVEAMKMQNPVRSPSSGKIQRILVREGMSVESGAPLMEILPLTPVFREKI